MQMNIEKKKSLVIFLEFPRTCGRRKVLLFDLTLSLAKILQALISTRSYASEKNACSIPEWEHYINYILSTLKYHRIGKKEVANTLQKIIFLQSVWVFTVLNITWMVFMLFLAKNQTSKQTKKPSQEHLSYVINCYILRMKHSIAQLPSSFLQKLSRTILSTRINTLHSLQEFGSRTQFPMSFTQCVCGRSCLFICLFACRVHPDPEGHVKNEIFAPMLQI